MTTSESSRNYSTYVVKLNMLMRTRQRVTRSTILAGTMSGGMKKETQLITTNIPEGRYTDKMKGPKERVRTICIPYTL